MVDEKYAAIISVVNEGLKYFSSFHHRADYFDPIDLELPDNSISWDLTKTAWADGGLSSWGKPGVYILFGRKEGDESVLGVYIGKASHNATIGSRLTKHLCNPQQGSKRYPMKDKLGNEFLLELVVTIPMEDEIHFLAPALEECLIYYLQNEGNYLINAVGKQ
jgi:hypothetical protein